MYLDALKEICLLLKLGMISVTQKRIYVLISVTILDDIGNYGIFFDWINRFIIYIGGVQVVGRVGFLVWRNVQTITHSRERGNVKIVLFLGGGTC